MRPLRRGLPGEDPAILENRYQKIENAKPPVEPKLFATVQLLWSQPKLWNLVTHMVGLGRFLGGRNGIIDGLPLFLAGWSDSRDTAVPPKKSFRQWFATDEAQELLAAARAEGLPTNALSASAPSAAATDNGAAANAQNDTTSEKE